MKVELACKETETSESETGPIEIPEIEHGTAGACYEFIPNGKRFEEDNLKRLSAKSRAHPMVFTAG